MPKQSNLTKDYRWTNSHLEISEASQVEIQISSLAGQAPAVHITVGNGKRTIASVRLSKIKELTINDLRKHLK